MWRVLWQREAAASVYQFGGACGSMLCTIGGAFVVGATGRKQFCFDVFENECRCVCVACLTTEHVGVWFGGYDTRHVCVGTVHVGDYRFVLVSV
jgi:hypothetical protein